MYFDDHGVPHFHAEYGEHLAKVRISDGKVFKGFLPMAQTKLVQKWAIARRAELLANWQRAVVMNPPLPKSPLSTKISIMSETLSLPATLASCKITRLRVTGPHRLSVCFADGLIAELEFTVWLKKRKGPVIILMRRADFFEQVYLDHGVLTWPNGFDLDPETVRGWAESGCCE